jgi:hypothetical protein
VNCYVSLCAFASLREIFYHKSHKEFSRGTQSLTDDFDVPFESAQRLSCGK